MPVKYIGCVVEGCPNPHASYGFCKIHRNLSPMFIDNRRNGHRIEKLKEKMEQTLINEASTLMVKRRAKVLQYEPCLHKGCQEKVIGEGWCYRHYCEEVGAKAQPVMHYMEVSK